MVFEDRLQFFPVLGLEKTFNRAVRELGKSGIGGRKDGEWSFAVQDVDEVCRTKSGREGLERTGRDGGFDYGLGGL